MSSKYFDASKVARDIPFDNSNNGFAAKNVQEALLETSTKLFATQVSASNQIVAQSGEDALMNSMTMTPEAGTYLVWFDCDIVSGIFGAAISVSVYSGGQQIATSLRKIIPFSGGTLTSGSARGSLSTHARAVVNGQQDIEIKWSSSNNGPSAAARTMTILRIG